MLQRRVKGHLVDINNSLVLQHRLFGAIYHNSETTRHGIYAVYLCAKRSGAFSPNTFLKNIGLQPETILPANIQLVMVDVESEIDFQQIPPRSLP